MDRLPVDILEKTVEIVREAAQLMLRRDFVVEQKASVVNIVTSADKQVQQFLDAMLPQLVPGSQVFGEEGTEVIRAAEYLWIVDPIDGTMNYARGIGISAISVALTRQGQPLIGVVYNPVHGEMFCAKKREGAWLNGKPIRASEASFAEALLCTAWSTYNKTYAPQCRAIMEEVYAQSNDFRRFGSCALELCYLAAGRCDLFFEFRIYPWDWAAGGLILMEAGGVITELEDRLPLHDRATPLIAANNRKNYEKLREIVVKYIPEIPYEEILL